MRAFLFEQLFAAFLTVFRGAFLALTGGLFGALLAPLFRTLFAHLLGASAAVVPLFVAVSTAAGEGWLNGHHADTGKHRAQFREITHVGKPPAGCSDLVSFD